MFCLEPFKSVLNVFIQIPYIITDFTDNQSIGCHQSAIADLFGDYKTSGTLSVNKDLARLFSLFTSHINECDINETSKLFMILTRKIVYISETVEFFDLCLLTFFLPNMLCTIYRINAECFLFNAVYTCLHVPPRFLSISTMREPDVF